MLAKNSRAIERLSAVCSCSNRNMLSFDSLRRVLSGESITGDHSSNAEVGLLLALAMG